MNKAFFAALTAALVVTGGLAASTDAAHADTAQPRRWCPGNPKHMPYIENDMIDWDWSVCHTWYVTNYGMGNVTMHGRPTGIWDGDNPPLEAITSRGCPPIAFMCP